MGSSDRSLVVAVLLVGLCLTGCSNGGGAPAASGGSPQSASSTIVPGGSAVDADGPVTIELEPAGDPVAVPALLDADTLLQTTVDGVEFQVLIPAGAVQPDVTFVVTPARTQSGDAAMSIEPAGWGLLIPASVTATDDRALLAWGPTGRARRLPDRESEDASTEMVLLGGIAVAHDDAQAAAADTATGRSVADTWATEQERAAHTLGRLALDPSITVRHLSALVGEMECDGSDRAAAAKVLAAVRAGIALDAAPRVPPSCVTVTAKITASMSTSTGLEELMSGGGTLLPDGSGHHGRVELAVEGEYPKVAGSTCTMKLLTDPDVFDVTARWLDDGRAELTLVQVTMAQWEETCPETAAIRLPLFIAAQIDGFRENNIPLTVTLPVTEGSFYIFSLLESTALAGNVQRNGELVFNVDGRTSRSTFTVEVLYSLPS